MKPFALISSLSFFLSSFFFCVEAASVSEQTEVPLISRQQLFGNPEKAFPQLSYDGKKIAYLAPDANQVLNVWLQDREHPGEDRPVTKDKKRGVRSFQWQYDNENILYIQDRDGDENWHLYQTHILTQVTRDLTPFEGVRAEVVAYEKNTPQELLVQLNLRDPSLFDVYRINLKNGAIDLVLENKEHANQWLADHDLSIRAMQSYTEVGETLIRVRDDDHSGWRTLMQWGPEEGEGGLIDFSADNRFLYVLSSSEANTMRLLQISLSDGKKEVLAADPRYDISGVLEPAAVARIDAVFVDRQKPEWILLNPKLKEDFLALSRVDGAFQIISRDLKDQQWIVMYESDIHPAHFYLYDRSTKETHFLFSAKPRLEKYRFSKMTPISFTARDGMELYGYLTLPRDGSTKNLPTVLLVHGGPWARDSWGFSRGVQWLANRGYAVLQVNYRGSSGYGKAYLNAGNREWGGKMQTDLLDAKAWAVQQGYSDPKRVAIYGGSYGGYAVLEALTSMPEEFCCGVDVVGPSNLITLLQTFPPYWAAAKSLFDIRVGKLEADKAFLQSRSPLFKANRIKKPLLIAQGANDPRVKQAESDQIVAAMRRNGREVEYLLFSDEGHGFVRPENQFKFYAAAESFLAEHLGGRYEPPLPQEEWDSIKR